MPEFVARKAGTPLEEGEVWTYVCRRCSVRVQGGWPAVEAHVAVVHPDVQEWTYG